MHCRKQICSTCLFKTSMPTVPWNFKHPVSTRSRFLRATVCSTSSALCLHYACKRSYPFVEDSGFVSHVEKQRFGHGVVVSKVCFGNIGTWSFLATVSGKCGFQPFQLPMFAKCDALPKGDFFDLLDLSEESIPFVKSKCPLPTRSLRSLRAAAYSIPA